MVRALVRFGVTPNALTVVGLLMSGVAAWLIVGEHWIWAGVVFGLGSLMDMLDGSVARLSGLASEAGAFLDSTCDRVADGAVLGAIAVVFAHRGSDVGLTAALVALMASFLIPYTRARAEGLGIRSNTGGLMSRPERIIFVLVAIFLAPLHNVLAILTAVLAALTTVTVVQRAVHVCRALGADRQQEDPGS